MDVSRFMGGNWLRHTDLPAPTQVWTIRTVGQQMLGNDSKIVVNFNEHAKGLGLNKTNLRAIADAFGVNSDVWVGKSLEVYKDVTQFQGQTTPCIRVRVPAQQPGAPARAPQQQSPVAAPVQQQSVAAPQQPVSQPPSTPATELAPAPWAGQQPQQ